MHFRDVPRQRAVEILQLRVEIKIISSRASAGQRDEVAPGAEERVSDVRHGVLLLQHLHGREALPRIDREASRRRIYDKLPCRVGHQHADRLVRADRVGPACAEIISDRPLRRARIGRRLCAERSYERRRKNERDRQRV